MKKYFYIAAVALFMATCTKNSPVEDEPEEPETCVITMTTLASEVSFMLTVAKGSNNFVIDWGDGEKSNTNDADNIWEALGGVDDNYSFSHSYSGGSEHRITITGNNIGALLCGSNQLTSLDVSKNPALWRLECPDNQLTNLDVSQNSTLRILQCGGNQLTVLDVSKNKILYHLLCSTNQLTNLDVSRNPELFYLFCGYNQLTASALNDIFMSLPDNSNWGQPYTKNFPFTPPFSLNIIGNPGEFDCDHSIARAKGWKFPDPSWPSIEIYL